MWYQPRYATECWGTGGQSEAQSASAQHSDPTRVLKVCQTPDLTWPDLTWPDLDMMICCCDWQDWPMPQWDRTDCSVPTVRWPWTWTAWWRSAWRRRAWAPGPRSPATPPSTPRSSAGLATRPGFTRTRNGTTRSTFTRWHRLTASQLLGVSKTTCIIEYRHHLSYLLTCPVQKHVSQCNVTGRSR